MTVGDETRDVSAGDLVFVPPNAMRGIENMGSDRLSYVSASTPSCGTVTLAGGHAMLPCDTKGLFLALRVDRLAAA